MKILVTGGAGFIGSNLVDRLVREGHDVVIVDHHKRDKLRFENPKTTVYKMPFGDAGVQEVFEREALDAVFHLAAQISVPRSVEDPLHDATMNTLDSIQLLEFARKHDVKKFLFASSGGAIYGDYPERPTKEVFDSKPLSPYGISKQSFEHYMRSYTERYGMQTTALRFSNVYGPRQQLGGEVGVIAFFTHQFIHRKPMKIFGDGTSTRDYLYVGDVVDAFVKALKADYSGVVNIATGVEVTIKELYETIERIHGAPGSVSYVDARDGEVYRSLLDASLAKEVIGWEWKTTLEEGLKNTYAWHKKYASDNK